MSIRATARTNTRPVQLFEDYLDNFNEIVGAIAQEVHDDYAPVILQALSQQPGPVKRPIQWTSDKQRKAFFASSGFGKGIPYQRTGKLAAGWEVLLINEPGAFVIRIDNPAPAAKFVYGPLGNRSDQSVRQQFHINTQWIAAKPIVDNYLQAMIIDFTFRFKQQLQDFGSVTGTRTRAFTGG